MNNNMNTMIASARFDEELSTRTNIAVNKIEVTLDRYRDLKGTDIEIVIRTLASVMAEADRHLAEGDSYFDYTKDKIDAEARIDLIVSLIYKKDGDIEKITKDFCWKNGKAEAIELSDHYWAIPHNN